jgi:hypothetical protein
MSGIRTNALQMHPHHVEWETSQYSHTPAAVRSTKPVIRGGFRALPYTVSFINDFLETAQWYLGSEEVQARGTSISRHSQALH